MTFEIDQLAELLKDGCPKIDMAFLHGSAKDGIVRPHSDIDLALLINGKPTWELYQQVENLVESIAPGAPCDIGILNNNEPVYRFEALKGNLLFARDQEQYLSFFSLSCRQYEYQIADYQRQKRYRLMRQSALPTQYHLNSHNT